MRDKRTTSEDRATQLEALSLAIHDTHLGDVQKGT